MEKLQRTQRANPFSVEKRMKNVMAMRSANQSKEAKKFELIGSNSVVQQSNLCVKISMNFGLQPTFDKCFIKYFKRSILTHERTDLLGSMPLNSSVFAMDETKVKSS